MLIEQRYYLRFLDSRLSVSLSMLYMGQINFSSHQAKLVTDKGWRVAGRDCIADERWKIETTLMKWSSGDDCVDVVLTTG